MLPLCELNEFSKREKFAFDSRVFQLNNAKNLGLSYNIIQIELGVQFTVKITLLTWRRDVTLH